MSKYREEAREVERDARWTFWRFMPLTIAALVFLAGAGFALNSFGVFGRTVVERKVFENSYQRSEAFKARIATDEATLTEITRKLQSTDLDPTTRANLEAQASACRIRIETAKRQQ